MPTVEIFPKGEVILSRYRIDKRHGYGGQAIGYKGIDLQATSPWETQVFIKQYHDIIEDSAEADAFLEGLQQLKEQLRHLDTRVGLPLASGRDRGSLVCIFRFIEGFTLEQWLREGFDDLFVPRLARTLAHTTANMHRNGIAHLDLKPNNIMVEYNAKKGRVYINFVDFDASSIYGKGLRERHLRTYLYHAPEFETPDLLGSVGIKADIFSLGIMLYILLFSCHPFTGRGDYKTAIIHGRFEVPPSDYHKEVVDTVVSCLDPNPYMRPSAGVVSRCLNMHAGNGLKALTWTDRHQGRSLPSRTAAIFRLERTENGLLSQRIYEDDQIVGRTELKGMLRSDEAAQLPSQILRISFGENLRLSVISEEASVRLNGFPIPRGLPISSGKYRLSIAAYDFDLFIE